MTSFERRKSVQLPKNPWFQILEQIHDNFEEATFVGEVHVVFQEMRQPWLHASYLNFVTGLVGYWIILGFPEVCECGYTKLILFS